MLEASEVGGPSKLSSQDATPEKLPAGLYVVATPIGNLGDITLRALTTLAAADRILCEDTRTSGAMLAKYAIKRPLFSYNDHNADQRRPTVLAAIAGGEAVALISDAGMPLIADPGFKLVRDCRLAGYAVTVIPGANAAITALAGSGLPTDRFLFAGFLPPRSVARQKALAELKTVTATLVFYEAPQRLVECLEDLVAIFGAEHPAAIARELTKFFEDTRQTTLEELQTHYKNHPPKGEIVIIVAPALSAAPATATDIDALLGKHLKTLSVRDAAAAVSLETGIRKSDAYARALIVAKALRAPE
jgi:16S rRNA (cytidine1402-2'-O)-methyltransferase